MSLGGKRNTESLNKSLVFLENYLLPSGFKLKDCDRLRIRRKIEKLQVSKLGGSKKRDELRSESLFSEQNELDFLRKNRANLSAQSKLKSEQLKILKDSNEGLKSQNCYLKKQVFLLKKARGKLLVKVKQLECELAQKKKEKNREVKKHAGTVSFLKRIKSKYNFRKKMKNSQTMTKISNLSDDLVECNNYDEGKAFMSGFLSSEKLAKRQAVKFLKVPIFKSDAKVTKRQLKNRAKTSWKVIKHFVNSNHDENIERFLATIITLDKTKFFNAAKLAGFDLQKKCLFLKPHK